MFVLLFLGGKPFFLVEQQRGLFRGTFLLFGLGDWRDEFRSSAAFKDPLGRLTGFIEFPVPFRTLVGRVDNRLFREKIRFRIQLFPTFCFSVRCDGAL